MEFGASHWLDVEQPTAEDLRRLAQQYGFPQLLVEDCLQPDHLPKFARTAQGGFVIVRAFDENAPEAANDIQSLTRKVAIFWGENFLITVHRSHLNWLATVWDDWIKKTNSTESVLGNIFYDILGEALYTFEDPIDRATLAIDNLEDAVFENHSNSSSQSILATAYLAKKRAAIFKRLLRLTRDILPMATKIGDPSSPAIQSLKEELERLFSYSDDLVETANDLVQMSISLSSFRTNDLVRLLTVVSLFLLPLNLVTGVYGMNFQFMPELKTEWGYPIVLASMLIIEVSIFIWLRRKNWIL